MNKQLNSVDAAIDCASDKIMEGIYERIDREYTLFSARMGWLLTMNSILFAPVFLTVRLLDDPSKQAYSMLLTICRLGVFITLILLIPMGLAIYTVYVLKQRENLIYRHLEEKDLGVKAAIFKLMNIDKMVPKSSVISSWPQRFRYTHDISMYLQLLVPMVVLVGWFACFKLLATTARASNIFEVGSMLIS